MGIIADLSSAIAWAESLAPDILVEVEKGLTLRRVETGAYLSRIGDPVDHWYGVVSGLVKLSVMSPEGKLLTLAGVPPGGWFAEGSVLRDTAFRYDIIAMRDTTVMRMKRATFLWLVNTSLEFNRFIIDQLNERLALFVGMVEGDRLLKAKDRVARSLTLLYNPRLYPGIEQRLHLSQEELGYLAGVSRQVTNQALQLLKARGIVSFEYGKITVLDFENLRRFRT